ncbi:MAG: acyltransferase [Lachnospiraceae bacterium]|nr:acyltransferase [Lachnospiraceae bacterium]MBQ7360502.1 acyltransferase [Lachnospiraceae bacterium]
METVGRTANRHNYLDLIRALSCVLVVAIHVSAVDFDILSYTSFEWSIARLINCIGMNGVPLFFMISGALLLNSEYQLSTKKLFFDKIGKLLLAYLLTCFFYNLVPFFRGWVPFEWYYIKECLLEGTIYGIGLYHVWFIPVLLGIYLLLPVLRTAFAKKENCEYFLLLFFIAGIVLPTLQLFELPGQIDRFLSHLRDNYFVGMITGYVGYFVLGHYLHSFVTFEWNRKKGVIVAALTVIAILATYAGCLMDSFKTGITSSLFNTPFSINLAVGSQGIFLLAKHLGSKIQSQKALRVIRNFASYTLGIYLLHPFVINTFETITKVNYIPVYLISILLRWMVVIVVTFSIVFCVKKIPGIKKLI